MGSIVVQFVVNYCAHCRVCYMNQRECIIQQAAENAGMRAGVYKMMNIDKQIIYIGKAKHLKNRLMSYTRTEKMPNRLKMMISHIHQIEVVVTKTEIEALILENNLIKACKPFFNILLKDDKTFPYIVISDDHEFPRIFKHRTVKPKGLNFFGPYPSVAALDEVLKIIQKAFLMRNCTDLCLKNANRPCLQYFIKRCSAPCVGKISADEYAQNTEFAKNLLQGKDRIVRQELVESLRQSASVLEFEKAAIARDKLKIISEIQSRQYIQIDKMCSIDFLAVALGSENSVVFVSFFRHGKNVGSDHFVVQNAFENDTHRDILEAFVQQFYRNMIVPAVIVLSHEIQNKAKLEIGMFAQNKTKIVFANSGVYKKIMETCLQNAKIKLNKEHIDEYKHQIVELNNVFGDSTASARIEVYDNSHLGGTNACGAMVVFESGKFCKHKHRVFNIDENTANGGDDIAMMQFTLRKRFASKSIKELPTLILIDGGKTQFSAAHSILKEFSLEEKVRILSIAKQNKREVGAEKILAIDNEDLPVSDLLLHFLITLRDEAHNKAIGFHKKKRKKTLSKSCLDEIPSIGAIRKQKLLEYFGSIDYIKRASVEDLLQVQGIDAKSAGVIFRFFNN